MKPETPKPRPVSNCIWHRRETRHLWFRHWVPKRYRGIEPKKLIQRSLGTPNKHEARIRAAALLVELHRDWERRLTGGTPSIYDPASTPSELDLQLAATEATFLRIQPKLDRIWREKQSFSEERYDAALQTLRRVRRKFIRTRETETLAQWRKIADRVIGERGWHLPVGSADYDIFVQMIAEAAIEVLGVEIARREGQYGAAPTSPIVVAGLATKRQKACPRETVSTLFEAYAQQRLAEKRKRQDTINQDRKVIERFAQFIGKDRNVRSILPSEIRDWRDTVARLPVNYKNAAAYAGLSLREIAAKASTLKSQCVSATTVNKYLSTISPFLGWCVTNGYADRNPCDGLFYDIPKGKNPRPPFTVEQLRQIFSSPLFTGFQSGGKEHLPGRETADDWRYWIPLLCLFTGARVGEVAQLQIGDVNSEAGVPYVIIRHDEATGQRTKSGYSRPVPIHSKLVAIGFLRFVERQRAARGGGPLFSELLPNERGQISATPSRFWRNYLKRIGVKHGRDGYGAHSFRHTVADLLRQADYLDDEIEVALGHNQKTVTSGYGQVRQGSVARISDMLEATILGDIFSGMDHFCT